MHWIKRFKILAFFLGFLFIVGIFFFPFLFKNLLPIPADTIVGMYHPFRDLYANNYPNGIPFKNFLITDPVRQIYPWKDLVLDSLFKFNLPLWNPYEMAGKPLLANFQSSVFYPLNIILFLQPFYFSWSMFIILQVFLAGFFLYLYLSNFNLDRRAIFLGVIAFCFSGFFISWLEWGTVGHTALWLPLTLLSIDKIFYHYPESLKVKAPVSQRGGLASLSRSGQLIKTQNYKSWSVVFVLSLVFSFFAGHLQIFFYLFTFSFIYLLAKWFQYKRNFKILILFFIFYILFLMLTFIQWYPTLQYILLSARSIDQSVLSSEGWFIPWEHLIQFIVPDFFGNPTTLNYWGTWNYAELIGYVGIIPLFFSLYAILSRHDKKTLFFALFFVIALLFSLPTFFAKIPYALNIPFLATSQPTRLLFLSVFTLSVLSSLGFDYFLKNKNMSKKIIILFSFFSTIFLLLWIFVFSGYENFSVISENIQVTKRNLILPTVVFAFSTLLIFLNLAIKGRLFKNMLIIILLILTSFELLRFSVKFEPFTNKNYLFPNTNSLIFLQKQEKPFRIISLDSRIFPPNFFTYYRLESIEGYDPLYLLSYAEYIASLERDKPDISSPFGFNRIITPHNFNSPLIDLLNVKYVLSLTEMKSEKLQKVFQEGQTIIYQNKNMVSRTFFVEEIKPVANKNEAIVAMFDKAFDLRKNAVVEGNIQEKRYSVGKVKIVSYSENRVVLETENDNQGFLVLTDSFYPTWHAKICIDENCSETKIWRTNYNFRGIIIPKGKHIVEFNISLI